MAESISNSIASMLAMRAEVGAAASDENPANRGSADQAGLAGAEIDLVLQLKEAFLPGSVHIVRNGRAAESDRLPQYGLDGAAQNRQFLGFEPARLAQRADAGMKETFIGVDVANAVQKLLIQQGGFDGRSTSAKQRSKRVYRDV